jgi:hypothetical protein
MSVNDREWVEVQWGPELYSPVSYQTVTIGPLTSRTYVREGETRQQAIGRVWNELNNAAKVIFAAERQQFLDRCAAIATDARERGKRAKATE